MSTILNLLCPICTEVFHNGDDIHCTSCGHIMHYRCIDIWRERSASCPQCRSPNPTTQKLYLCFDESAESAANLNELKAELIKLKDNTNGLKDDLKEKEDEISVLKEKLTVMDSEYSQRIEDQAKEIEKLNENIELLEEMNLSQCQEIENLSTKLEVFNASNDVKVNELNSELSKVKVENLASCQDSTDGTIITLNNELKKLQTEFDKSSLLLQNEVSKNDQLSRLITNLKSKDCELGEISCQLMVCEEKNKILEQKLKYITKEFEKEVSKSTQLEIEKMKLQNYVDCIKSNPTTTNSINCIPSLRNQRKTRVVATSSESLNSISGKKHNFSSLNSIVILKYPSIHLHEPLEDVILFIAMNIGVGIDKYDIDKVNIAKGNKHKLCERVPLFVRFKTKELKNKFLLNKGRLLASSIPHLKLVQITEYMDDNSQSLFAYAVEKLKGKGYNEVFLSNNRIFAKRQKSDPKGVRILNRQHVNELLEQELN